MPTRCLFLICLWLWIDPVLGQTPAAPCGCDYVQQQSRRFGDKKDYPKSEAQTNIQAFAKLFEHTPDIVADDHICQDDRPASSMICLRRYTPTFYVFFDANEFTKLRQSQSDRFILAHEVSHHVLGHTTQDFYQTRETQRVTSFPRRAYGITISNEYLTELQADALGLWLCVNRGLQPDSLPRIFAALHRIPYLNKGASKTHPSLSVRRDILTYLLARYVSPQQTAKLNEQYRSTYRRFANGDSSLTEAVNPVESDVYDAYSFLLARNKGDLDSLNAFERTQRDTLIRRNHFSFDVLGGGQIVHLSRQYNTVPTRFSQGYVVGFRIGFGAWFQPRRFETDLLLGTSQFTTYGLLNGIEQPVEQFQTTYVYVRPRYVWSRIAHESKRGYRTSGWMITAGGAVGIPVHLAYKNVAFRDPVKPRQQLSPALVAGLGYGKSNWTNRVCHWRVWLMYQPQCLRFDTPPSERSRAMLHTLSLEGSLRFR